MGGLDVLPGFAGYDSSNSEFTNAIFSRNFIEACPFRKAIANCLHRLNGEFAFLVSLKDGINYVVPPGSQKEMVWINAPWIITARTVVANLKALWNLPAQGLPSKAMRVDNRAIDGDTAVSKALISANPNPTRVVAFLNLNVIPEILDGINTLCNTLAGLAAKPMRPPISCPDSPGEWLAAGFARILERHSELQSECRAEGRVSGASAFSALIVTLGAY